MAVQVNDSKDGEERTRILGGFVDSVAYSPLVFTEVIALSRQNTA